MCFFQQFINGLPLWLLRIVNFARFAHKTFYTGCLRVKCNVIHKSLNSGSHCNVSKETLKNFKTFYMAMYYGSIPIRWLQLEKFDPLPQFSKKIIVSLWNILKLLSLLIYVYLGTSWKEATAVNRDFNRQVKGCASNVWDELNVMRFCGFSEWKYLVDIYTKKETTAKKVALKSFQEQGLIGLCANF